MHKYATVSLMALGVATVSGALTPSDALAVDRRITAITCRPATDDYGNQASSTYYNGVRINFESNAPATNFVRCPVPSDSFLFASQVVGLNVHGFTNTGTQNWSKACSTYWGGASTTCGNAKVWGTQFAGAYGVDVSPWQNGGMWNYDFLLSQVSRNGAFFGFYVTN